MILLLNLLHSHGFDELQLRGQIAFAARCARRVFPSLVPMLDSVEEIDAQIAVAESFAAGEHCDFFQANRVRDACIRANFSDVSRLRSQLQRSVDEPRAVDALLASASALGFATFSGLQLARLLELTDGPDERMPNGYDDSGPMRNALEGAVRKYVEDLRRGVRDTSRVAMLATEPLVVEERAVPTDSDEYRRFAIDHPVRAREAEWARQAVMRDFNRLMESRSVALKRESDEPSPGLSAVKWDYNRFMESLTVVPKLREELKRERDEPFPEMGMPIDPSVRGPLGPLWEAGCVPKWFQEGMDRWRPPRAISVATGSEFLAEIRSVATFPDIVCWYLRPDADLTELENLEGALTRVQSESRSLGRIRPVFSVYAPGIEEGRRLRLIDLGANVYYEPWDEWFKPTDAESFGKMIKDRYQETYRGWKSDDRGLWTCVDARVGWRSFGRRPSLARAETPSGAEAASCQATRTPDEAPKVSSEDYRQLLEYLYSEDSSEAEY